MAIRAVHALEIVEAVSHQSLEEYFQEHIFRPLGMPDTSFNVPAEKQGRVATVRPRQTDTITVVAHKTAIPERIGGDLDF